LDDGFADLDVGFGLEVDFALEAGFALDLDAGFGFALVLEAGFFASPVTAFFAAPFLVFDTFFLVTGGFFAVVTFLVVAVVFFGAAGGFLAVVEAAGFFVVVTLVVRTLGFVPPFTVCVVGFLVVAALVAAGLALEVVDLVVAGFLVVGLVFSLAAPVRTLGASFTFPEGPLGRTKMPFSLPWAMARLSWVAAAALRSMWYLLSTNFLIAGRETPVRESSGLLTIHSLIISTQGGCVAA